MFRNYAMNLTKYYNSITLKEQLKSFNDEEYEKYLEEKKQSFAKGKVKKDDYKKGNYMLYKKQLETS